MVREEISGKDGNWNMSDKIKKQVLEMSAGIMIHALFLMIGAAIWFRSLEVFLGILVGAAAAVVLLWSMAYSTEMCMEYGDEEFARKKMVMHSGFRSLAILAGLFAIWKFTNISLLAAALGVLGLKTGAYLYPAVHRFIAKKDKK